MDEKDFVSFETAKRLKVAGFDELCNYYYTSEDAPKEHIWLTGSSELANFNEITTNNCPIKCSAPTLYHAQKWLWEEKGILLWAYPDRQPVDEDWSDVKLTGEWWWDIDGNTRESSGDTYPSYKAALSAGIDASLNLIIEPK